MEHNNHRILILGATGQIGSCLVPLLAQRGHFVIAVSRSKHNLFQSEIKEGKVECVFVRTIVLCCAGRISPLLREYLRLLP